MPVPAVFEMIHKASKTPWKEMYQVFNMGHRMEIYIDRSVAQDIIYLSESMGIPAQIIGEVRDSAQNKVTIESQHGTFEY
jgi:phosphoribosylformylglycinamidine cyclo-ligase